MSSVWGMISQWGSTIEVSIELSVATRHRSEMTEKLLKAMLNPIKQQHKELEWVFMKHYALNICLPLKITWKQDTKVRKGA